MPGQVTNGDNLGIFFFDLLDNNGMLSVLNRILMSTLNIQLHDKIRNVLNYLFSWAIGRIS